MTTHRPTIQPPPLPLRTFVRVTWITAGVGAGACIAGILGVFGHRTTQSILLTVWGGSLAVIGAMTAAITHFVVRRLEREIRALLDGDYLAHWHYTDTEWRRFTEAEWARSKHVSLGAALGQITVLGAIVAWLVPDSLARGSLALRLGIGVGFAIAATAITIGVRFLHSWWDHRRRLRGAAEVVIGARGLYWGTYVPWTGYGIRLGSVTLDAGDPPVIDFEVRVSRGDPYHVRVAVPHGHQHEAHELVRLLT